MLINRNRRDPCYTDFVILSRPNWQETTRLLPVILTMLVKLKWPLSAGDLNRSMQHLHSSTREEDVENEATTQDLLQLRTKKLDVGSLAAR